MASSRQLFWLVGLTLDIYDSIWSLVATNESWKDQNSNKVATNLKIVFYEHLYSVYPLPPHTMAMKYYFCQIWSFRVSKSRILCWFLIWKDNWKKIHWKKILSKTYCFKTWFFPKFGFFGPFFQIILIQQSWALSLYFQVRSPLFSFPWIAIALALI